MFEGMAAMKGEEAIVKGDEEIGGRKRVNEDMDTRLAKRAKVEGNEAVDCRNLVIGYKVEGETACDGTQGEVVEQNNELDRLRGLLRDYPERLKEKDIEVLIRNLDAHDIISLALRSGKAKEKTISNYGYLDLEVACFVPSPEKVYRLMGLMLVCGVEELKAVDLFILYNNFPKAAFASLLLHALDSYSKRRLDGRSLYPKAMCDKIYMLCRVLPWTLFTHVMFKMTSHPVFKYSTSTTSEEDDEELNEDIRKKAAESCNICYGKAKHSGVYGYYCSFFHSVPCEATVGPSYMVVCSHCGMMSGRKTFGRCGCGSQKGKAVPRSFSWKRV